MTMMMLLLMMMLMMMMMIMMIMMVMMMMMMKVLAFMETKDTTTDFPIGVNGWHFLDSDCVDPGQQVSYCTVLYCTVLYCTGQQVRSLNLHLEVEQPGHFCCEDGTCVDSGEATLHYITLHYITLHSLF